MEPTKAGTGDFITTSLSAEVLSPFIPVYVPGQMTCVRFYGTLGENDLAASAHQSIAVLKDRIKGNKSAQ